MEPVGDGVSELRIHVGAGWRVYFTQRGGQLVVLLTDILQANDAGLLSAALVDIARARGMTDIAKAAGITREAPCKALRPGSAPRFDTVNRVGIALGVRLVVLPLHSA